MTFSPYRVLGAAAIAGGALRIGSSFLDWSGGGAALEALALAIDLLLLLGLSGFYFANAARLGALGFIGYAVAASGIALITGPDGMAFGIDIYQTSVAVIGVGLAGLSVLLLLRRIAPLAGLAWIAAVAASMIGTAIGRADAGFVVAGILFGLGFVATGFGLIRRERAK